MGNEDTYKALGKVCMERPGASHQIRECSILKIDSLSEALGDRGLVRQTLNTLRDLGRSSAARLLQNFHSKVQRGDMQCCATVRGFRGKRMEQRCTVV